MKCMICDQIFNEPRMLKDLFRTKQFHVCLNCLKNYPIKINFSHIPLENHMLEVVTLFENDKNINYDAFLEQYSLIYKKIREINSNKIIIFLNKLYLTDEFIEEYDHLSRLIDKEIVVLTNVLLD